MTWFKATRPAFPLSLICLIRWLDPTDLLLDGLPLSPSSICPLCYLPTSLSVLFHYIYPFHVGLYSCHSNAPRLNWSGPVRWQFSTSPPLNFYHGIFSRWSVSPLLFSVSWCCLFRVLVGARIVWSWGWILIAATLTGSRYSFQQRGKCEMKSRRTEPLEKLMQNQWIWLGC